MAEFDQPTISPRPDALLPETSNERHDQLGTSSTAGNNGDRNEYVLKLENEVRKLRGFQQQVLQERQAGPSHQYLQPQPTVMSSVPPLLWIPDDKIQVVQFVGTLPSNYPTTMGAAGSYSQTFPVVCPVDSEIRAQNTHGNERFGGRISHRTSWCSSCRSKHVGPCTPQTNKCLKCGELGHEIKNCRYPNFVCWNCRKEGHRAGQCPERDRRGYGSVDGSSSSGRKRKKQPPAADRAFR